MANMLSIEHDNSNRVFTNVISDGSLKAFAHYTGVDLIVVAKYGRGAFASLCHLSIIIIFPF